jgi:CBS domain-containing membrane protein
VKVADLMSAPPITVDRTDSLAFAEELMNVESIHHLAVVDGDVMVGVISHRDVLAASISTLSNPSEEDELELKRRTEVARVMHGTVEAVTPATSLVSAAELLLTHRVGCLPVVDERHRIVGMLTNTDFVRFSRDLLRRGSVGEPAAPASRRVSSGRR